jgi:uncharacterized membrane protein
VLTILVVALVAGVLGVATGGSLRRLAETRLRALWLVYAGLVIQVGAMIWLSGSSGLAAILLSFGVIALFLALNYKQPGMTLAAIGLILNIAVIATNGAMPVSSEAAAQIGASREAEPGGVKHEPMTDDTRLPWLGDVLPLPIVDEVWSLGDVVLACGLGYFVYRRAKPVRRGRHSMA